MVTSSSRLRTCLSMSCGIMTALGACESSSTTLGDEPGAETLPANDHAALVDASLDAGAFPVRSPGDGGATSAPAQSDDAGPVCTAGQVRCGTSCIESIATTATAIQERVFQRSCALTRSCHTGNAPQAELNLGSVDAVFESAVGKRSTQVPSIALIAPGRPEDSYLVRKLRDTHTVGTSMPPPPSAPLCEAKIQVIEAWIRAGAAR